MGSDIKMGDKMKTKIVMAVIFLSGCVGSREYGRLKNEVHSIQSEQQKINTYFGNNIVSIVQNNNVIAEIINGHNAKISKLEELTKPKRSYPAIVTFEAKDFSHWKRFVEGDKSGYEIKRGTVTYDIYDVKKNK